MPEKHAPEVEKAFLEALSDTCNVSTSCRLAGVGRATVYAWREANPDFAARWKKAKAIGADALEDEAMRRAMGYDEPVFHGGKQIGVTRKFSDTLLIFLLKGAKPEKYRERVSSEISGPGGKPIEISEAECVARLKAILENAAARLDRGEDLV